MHTPQKDLWKVATHVVNYLKECLGQVILLSSVSPLSLTAYCDSDWASCPLTRLSIAGYFVCLGGFPVSGRLRSNALFFSLLLLKQITVLRL